MKKFLIFAAVLLVVFVAWYAYRKMSEKKLTEKVNENPNESFLPQGIKESMIKQSIENTGIIRPVESNAKAIKMQR